MSHRPESNLLKQKSNEVQLIFAVAALRPEMSVAQHAGVMSKLNQNIDWDRLIELATRLDVLAVIVYNLKHYFSLEIPPYAMERSEKLIAANAIRNMVAIQSLVKISRRCLENGIPVLNFKGPTLVARVYDNFSQRLYGDLDFFVRKAHYEKVVEQLYVLGYQQLTVADAALWGRPAFDLKKGYHRAFFHPDLPFNIELHWRLSNEESSMAIPEDFMWSNVQSVRWGTIDVYTFSDELLVLLLSVHGAKHRWAKLKWVCDIAFMLQDQHQIDWKEYLDLARRFQCLRRALLSIDLACNLFDLSMPSVVRDEIQRNPEVERLRNLVILWLQSEDQRPYTLEKLSLMSNLYDSTSQRIHHQLGMLPNTARDLLRPSERDRRFIQLPKQLSFLYILFRPIRYLLDRFQSTQASNTS